MKSQNAAANTLLTYSGALPEDLQGKDYTLLWSRGSGLVMGGSIFPTTEGELAAPAGGAEWPQQGQCDFPRALYLDGCLDLTL